MGVKKINIDTIVFDLGGVLVDWNPVYVYKEVYNGDMQKANWFLNNVCTSEWNIEQDAGRTIKEAVKLKVSEFPEYKTEIQLYYEQWHRMFSGPIKENVALFDRFTLNERYSVYALTNWSAEKWQEALKLFPFFNNFDGHIVSGQEKTRKPFDKIYHILLERFALVPEQTLFIDDNKENVTAAQNNGLQGIHYKEHSQLLKDLKALGIKY